MQIITDLSSIIATPHNLSTVPLCRREVVLYVVRQKVTVGRSGWWLDGNDV